MEKANFGTLISKLVDDLPANPYIDDDDEIEQGKSITPPPGFDEVTEKDPDNKNESLSRSATLKSPHKMWPSLKSFKR